MPRESETFRDTLVRVSEKAEKLFPGKMEFNKTEAAAIIGRTRRTIYEHRCRYGFGPNGYYTTCEKIARGMSREG